MQVGAAAERTDDDPGHRCRYAAIRLERGYVLEKVAAVRSESVVQLSPRMTEWRCGYLQAVQVAEMVVRPSLPDEQSPEERAGHAVAAQRNPCR